MQKGSQDFSPHYISCFGFSITAEEHSRLELTKNDGRFISHYKGVAHVNPKVIHRRQSYVSCNLAIMVAQMKHILALRQKICDKSFNLNKDRPALDNRWGRFLALNYTTSLPVARQSCTTLGLALPEVKSAADIKELRSFMAQVGVASVFVGITFDYNQHGPTFNSDQS